MISKNGLRCRKVSTHLNKRMLNFVDWQNASSASFDIARFRKSDRDWRKKLSSPMTAPPPLFLRCLRRMEGSCDATGSSSSTSWFAGKTITSRCSMKHRTPSSLNRSFSGKASPTIVAVRWYASRSRARLRASSYESVMGSMRHVPYEIGRVTSKP